MSLQETEGRIAVIFSMYDDEDCSNDDIIDCIFSLCQHCHTAASDGLKLGKFEEVFAHLARAEEALDESRSDRKVFASTSGQDADVVATVRSLRERSLYIMRQFEDYRTGRKGKPQVNSYRSGSAGASGGAGSTARVGAASAGSSRRGGSNKLLAPIPPASSGVPRPRFMQRRNHNDLGTKVAKEEDGAGYWRTGLRGNAGGGGATYQHGQEDDDDTDMAKASAHGEGDFDDDGTNIMRVDDDPQYTEQRRLQREMTDAKERHQDRQRRRQEAATSPYSAKSGGSPYEEDTLVRAMKAQRAATQVSRHMEERARRKETERLNRLREAEHHQSKKLQLNSQEIEMRREGAEKKRIEVEKKLLDLQTAVAEKTAQRKTRVQARLASQRVRIPPETTSGGGDHSPGPTLRESTEAPSPKSSPPRGHKKQSVRAEAGEEEEDPNRLVAASSSSDSEDESALVASPGFKRGLKPEFEPSPEGSPTTPPASSPLAPPGGGSVVPAYRTVAPLALSVSEQHPMHSLFKQQESDPLKNMSRLDRVHAEIQAMPKKKQPKQQVELLKSFLPTTEEEEPLDILAGGGIAEPTLDPAALDLRKQMASITLQKFARKTSARREFLKRRIAIDEYVEVHLKQHAAFLVILRALRGWVAEKIVTRLQQRVAYLNLQRIDLELQAHQRWSPGRRESSGLLSPGSLNYRNSCTSNSSSEFPSLISSPTFGSFFAARKRKSTVGASAGSTTPASRASIGFAVTSQTSSGRSSCENNPLGPESPTIMVTKKNITSFGPPPSIPSTVTEQKQRSKEVVAYGTGSSVLFQNPFKKGHRKWDRMNEVHESLAALVIQLFYRGYREYAFEQDIREMRHLINFATLRKSNPTRASWSRGSQSAGSVGAQRRVSIQIRGEEVALPYGQRSHNEIQRRRSESAPGTDCEPPGETPPKNPTLAEIRRLNEQEASSPQPRQPQAESRQHVAAGSETPTTEAPKPRPDLPFAPLRYVDLHVLAREEAERVEALRFKKQQEEEALQRAVEKRRNEIQRAVARAAFLQRTCRAFQVRLRLATQRQRVLNAPTGGVHSQFGRRLSQTFANAGALLASQQGDTISLSGESDCWSESGRESPTTPRRRHSERGREFNSVSYHVQDAVLAIIGRRNPHLLPEKQVEYQRRRENLSTQLNTHLRCLQSQLIRWNLQRHNAARIIQVSWSREKNKETKCGANITSNRSEVVSSIVPGMMMM